MSPALINHESSMYVVRRANCGLMGEEVGPNIFGKIAKFKGATVDDIKKEFAKNRIVLWPGDQMTESDIDDIKTRFADTVIRVVMPDFEKVEIDQEIQDQMPEMDGRGGGCLAALLGL